MPAPRLGRHPRVALCVRFGGLALVGLWEEREAPRKRGGGVAFKGQRVMWSFESSVESPGHLAWPRCTELGGSPCLLAVGTAVG